MLARISAAKIASVLAAMLAVSVAAFAEDMKGMDMSGHDMSQMSADEAMDHDMHMGHGDMKNMSLHMAYTDLRPGNDADKARAAVLVTDLQHRSRSTRTITSLKPTASSRFILSSSNRSYISPGT